MTLRMIAVRLAAVVALFGLAAFATEPAKAGYYGGCGYSCGGYVAVAAPSYGCGSCCNNCGTSYYYAVPSPVIVQPVSPCGGCGYGYGTNYGYGSGYGYGYGVGYQGGYYGGYYGRRSYIGVGYYGRGYGHGYRGGWHGHRHHGY